MKVIAPSVLTLDCPIPPLTRSVVTARISGSPRDQSYRSTLPISPFHLPWQKSRIPVATTGHPVASPTFPVLEVDPAILAVSLAGP
jgi:hypothetical protein